MTGSWLSWNANKFLILSKTGGKLGIWDQKSQTPITLNLFIKASYIETSGNGTYQNPFGNLVKALSYADEQTAENENATINICRFIYFLHFRFLERWPLYDS